MSKKYAIAKEVAEESFDRFCEYHEIENDINEMNDEEKESFQKFKDDIVKAIRAERMVIQESNNFIVEYMVSKFSEKSAGDVLIIKRPKGKSYMRMDDAKKDHDVKKGFSMLASVIDKELSYFGNLDAADIKPLQAVVTLFLA